jgi:lipopolysaccharide export system protein LptA
VRSVVRSISAFVTAVLAFGVWAPLGAAAPADADQPIDIRADSAELDDAKGIVVYRGNVRMDQGSLRVTADTMTIALADEQVVSITAEGEQAHYQQRFEADAPEVRAEADTIVYHTQEERVELRGNARLTQDPNEFSGEVINYDIRAGKVDARSTTSGGVRMTFKPPKAGE